MNISQNGEFSKNLHKLTKYQSLAATVNDMSKQSLYSKKVQEYRNKLDKVSGVQTGGVTKDEILGKIRGLVPSGWKQAYISLKEAHTKLSGELSGLIQAVSVKIQAFQQAKQDSDRFVATVQDFSRTDPNASGNPKVKDFSAEMATYKHNLLQH